MQDQLDIKMNVVIMRSVDLLFTRHCPDFANGKGKFIKSHTITMLQYFMWVYKFHRWVLNLCVQLCPQKSCRRDHLAP